MASSRNSLYQDIYTSTVGIVSGHRDYGLHDINSPNATQVFLGTPHKGLEGSENNILPILLKLARTDIPDGEAPMFDAMNPGRAFLDEMRGDFSSVCDNISLICAYEKQNQKQTVSISRCCCHLQYLVTMH